LGVSAPQRRWRDCYRDVEFIAILVRLFFDAAQIREQNSCPRRQAWSGSGLVATRGPQVSRSGAVAP
jgi:hypothetical protein